MPQQTPLLFRQFPGTANQLPHYPLVDAPTPINRLEVLQRRTGAASLWIKDDETTAKPVGGGGTRKLEWILGHAASVHAKSLLSSGPESCEFLLAASIHAQQANYNVEAVMYPCPKTRRNQRVKRAISAHGTKSWPAPSPRFLSVLTYWQTMRGITDPKKRARLKVPAGGHSPWGALGFVQAGLELAEQIRNGELPEPMAIFVPAVTGTSAAGLHLGCRIAGLNSKIVAVDVAGQCSERQVMRLANNTAQFLVRNGAGSPIPKPTTTPTLLTEFSGSGFGHDTPAARETRSLMAEIEGLKLSAPFIAKAFSGLIRQIVDWAVFRREPVLFWNTSAGTRFPVPKS